MPKLRVSHWSVNIKRRLTIQWVHNPIVAALVPFTLNEKKQLLKPWFDLRIYQPGWFRKRKKNVSLHFVEKMYDTESVTPM